ncbi:hypothetical protein EDD22DRAFT_845374 [Suillus occidentalis]|nr:hypothetical protein EDD22DRAFT_845374 [Suillus occidentalis]
MAKHAASNDGAPTLKCIRIDDGNQTILTTPLADKHAWAILEQFLTMDMTYPQMEDTLLFDDELALANLRAVKAKHIHPALSTPKDSSMADRRSTSARIQISHRRAKSKNPYLDLAAADEEKEEEEEEEEENHNKPSEPWKVTSLPGLSSATRFTAAINKITNQFEGTQPSPSQDCQTIPTLISGLIPLAGLQDRRMYLLHIQRNVTDYIAAHLQRKKFAVKVSAWIAGQLYVVADSPKTIADSLPFSLYLTMKQYLVITDEEREMVERSCSKLPILAWVRIKHGKYKGCKYKGERYYMGLLLHNFHRDHLECVVCPHVNDIELHLQSGWDKSFLKSTVVAFSMQFLHAGDWAKIVKGDLSSEVGMVTSTNHTVGSATLDLSLSGHRKEVECRLQDIERVFRIGDTVRVVAGLYFGVEGLIIEMVDDIFCLCQDVSKEEVEVSKYYLDQRPLTHMQQERPPMQQLFTPPTDVELIQIGDCVEVLVGEHIGKSGIVRWLPKGGGTLWFQDRTLYIPVPIAVVRRIHLPHLQTLQFTKDKGYDVKPGDIVRVARGPEYQMKGIIRSVDFPNAHLTLLSDIDHSLVDVPISFTMKIHNTSLDSFKQDIGQEVFIIGGDRKGYRATLYSLAVEKSMHYNPTPECCHKVWKETKHSSVAIAAPGTSSSAWTNWTTSPDDQASSPLPSINPSTLTTNPNPWTVNTGDTLDNIDSRSEKLKEGPLAWLMKKEFSSKLTTYHMMLKVSPSFMRGRLHNRFVSTACPDPFLSLNGPTPEGCVAVFCSSNGAGATIQHYHIPITDLS